MNLNINLLSTSIMVVFGIHGHGNCHGQSIITSKVLKKMGYDARCVGGYHAIMYMDDIQDYFVLHAPQDLVPKQLQQYINQSINDIDQRDWYHCWVEFGNSIVDINLHIKTEKLYTDIKDWTLDHLINGKCYYMPTSYDLDQEDVCKHKIKRVIDVYKELIKLIPCSVQSEEGPIFIKDDGTWYPLPGYKFNKNILPHTKAFLLNNDLVNQLEEILT